MVAYLRRQNMVVWLYSSEYSVQTDGVRRTSNGAVAVDSVNWQQKKKTKKEKRMLDRVYGSQSIPAIIALVLTDLLFTKSILTKQRRAALAPATHYMRHSTFGLSATFSF